MLLSPKVVITNELTTRLAGSNDPAQLVPALGDSHSHRVTQQIMLGRDIGAQQTAGRHLAHIRKSLYRPESIVAFRVSRLDFCCIYIRIYLKIHCR